jgi:hypothetical protein
MWCRTFHKFDSRPVEEWQRALFFFFKSCRSIFIWRLEANITRSVWGIYRIVKLKCAQLHFILYECVSRSFRTGRLERELLMVQLSATRCSCIAILWGSLVGFAAISLCVASQRVFIVVYFVIDSVRKLLDTPSYVLVMACRYAKWELWVEAWPFTFLS